MNEGVIKFNIKEWDKNSLENIDISDIESIREKLYDMKLIGFYKELNLGYGNISKRINDKEFIISGSQTGHLQNLTIKQYSLINGVDFNSNFVLCKGDIEPSSESLTHAAFYNYSKTYNAVIHIHSLKIWESLIKRNFLSTPEDAEYGSEKLWLSIKDIINQNSNLDSITVVMKGHKEGIITAGKNLDFAFNNISQIYSEFNK